jgi:hypothetical protein
MSPGNIVSIDACPAVLAEVLFTRDDWVRVRILDTGEELSLYMSECWVLLDHI